SGGAQTDRLQPGVVLVVGMTEQRAELCGRKRLVEMRRIGRVDRYPGAVDAELGPEEEVFHAGQHVGTLFAVEIVGAAVDSLVFPLAGADVAANPDRADRGKVTPVAIVAVDTANLLGCDAAVPFLVVAGVLVEEVARAGEL